MRNDGLTQAGHGWSVAGAIMVQCIPPLLLAFAAVIRIDLKVGRVDWRGAGAHCIIINSKIQSNQRFVLLPCAGDEL